MPLESQSVLTLESAEHNAWHTLGMLWLFTHSLTHSFIHKESTPKENYKGKHNKFYQQFWSFDKDFGNGEWERRC